MDHSKSTPQAGKIPPGAFALSWRRGACAPGWWRLWDLPGDVKPRRAPSFHPVIARTALRSAAIRIPRCLLRVAGGFGRRPYAGMGLDGSQFVRAVPVRLDGGRLIAAPTHRWETVCVPICAGNSRHAVRAADLHRSVEPCRVSSRPVGALPGPARVLSRKISQDPLNPTGFPLLSVGAANSRPLSRVAGPTGECETVWGFVPVRRGRCPHRPCLKVRLAALRASSSFSPCLKKSRRCT